LQISGRWASVRSAPSCIGILPGLVLQFAELEDLTGAFGR